MICKPCKLQMRVLATRCRNGETFRRCACPRCDLRVWVKVTIIETMVGTPAPKPAWSTNVKKPQKPKLVQPAKHPQQQAKPLQTRPKRHFEPEPIIDETEHIDADDLRVFGIEGWRE